MGSLREPNKYICFEGVDGSGKTTLAMNLAKDLGDTAYVCRFPSDGIVGQMIRRFLSGGIELVNPKALLYLYAADGEMEDPKLHRALAERHIICDRHPTISGRAYQPKHHPVHHIEMVYGSAELFLPDLLFFVDVPPEVTVARCSRRDKYRDVVFEDESLAGLEKIRRRYMEMAAKAAREGWAQRVELLDGCLPEADLLWTVKRIAGLT